MALEADRALASDVPAETKVFLDRQRGKSRRPSGTRAMPAATISASSAVAEVRAGKRYSTFDAIGPANDGLEQRRFAGAIGADDGHDLAGVDAEIDAVDGSEIAVEYREPFDRRSAAGVRTGHGGPVVICRDRLL